MARHLPGGVGAPAEEHAVPEAEVAGVAPQQVDPDGEDGPEEELAGVEGALPQGHHQVGEDVEGDSEQHQRVPEELLHSKTPSTPNRPRGRTRSSPAMRRKGTSSVAGLHQ